MKLYEFILNHPYLAAVVMILATLALFLGAVVMQRRRGQGGGEAEGRYWKWLLVPGVMVLILLVVWLFRQETSLQSPSLGDVWDWTKGHWLWILLASGAVALLSSLVTFPEGKEKVAGALQKSVLVLLAMLWFVIPICYRFWGEKPARPVQQQAIREKARALPHDTPDLPRAWNPDGSPTDVSKWPQVQVPPKGDSVHVSNLFGGHVVWGGSGFEVHCVYSDDSEGIVGDIQHPCSDGNIVESYARNKGDTLLYARYAYANKGEK